MAVVVPAGKTNKLQKAIHKMPTYPGRVVDPKYSADDVFLQVSRDKLNLDRSMAVDSIFRPVLWTQLNRMGTETHIQTEKDADKSTADRQRKAKKTPHKNMDDLLVSGPKPEKVIFISSH
ncbi:hypothetical protein ILYODFUR_032552 [Ilyodon furcidens]|uniref:Uncharacterized protein n=1 Tax=Ilyodon furcidens TaxID=33524 RepID=A0ABV0U3D6_9TELE